jgi:hypothetical protein
MQEIESRVENEAKPLSDPLITFPKKVKELQFQIIKQELEKVGLETEIRNLKEKMKQFYGSDGLEPSDPLRQALFRETYYPANLLVILSRKVPDGFNLSDA